MFHMGQWVEQNTGRRKPAAGIGMLCRSKALILATKEYTIIQK